LEVDHDGFVIGELEVGVFQDCTAGDKVEVAECEGGVVDDGGTVDCGWSKTKGADAGVGGVGGAGEREPANETEEGSRGEEVKKVSSTSSGEVGRLG
jgi:methyl coenzyme M reductase subunit C-like uncharacterized protein (methanogenesis marker protein 7)